MDTASPSVHDPDSRPALEAQQWKRARFETSKEPPPLTSSEEALSQETRGANITNSFLDTSDAIHVKEPFTDNIMVFAASSNYSSATKEFCSLFNAVGGSPRSSPKGEHAICRSSRDLVLDRAFQDSGCNGYGSGHSAAEALCGELGLPSPIFQESPESLGMTDVLKRVTAESLDHCTEENAVNFPRSTQLMVAETQPSLNTHPEDTEKQVELQVPTVFVWDLDETLIVFQTLSDGRYAALFDGFKDSHTAIMLGQRWERLILEICDEYFFYKQVEKYNFPNLDLLRDCDDGIDLEDYDFEEDNLEFPSDDDNMRKLSYRHRYAGRLYEQGVDAQGLEKLLSSEQMKEWHDLYEATDQYTDGWLTAGRQKVEEFQKANHTVAEANCKPLETFGPHGSEDNVESASERAVSPSKYNFLVTSGTLIPSLVKCLLFRLNSHFHHENIYSSREAGKLQCFQWIRNRLLPKSKFCVIGDGIDECEAAQALKWPFVKIVTEPDALHRLPSLSFATVEEHIKAVYGGLDGLGISGF